MSRRLIALVAVMAGASVASAQIPPSINKPIEQARKNVAATNAQTALASPDAKAGQGAKPAARTPAAKAPAAKAAVPAPVKDSSKISFDREVFAYVSEGRRDPFASPIETGEIRPLVADLRLVGVIYDPAGRNSVAVMRDQSTGQQYRAKAGQILGRARVSQVRPQEVVMTIEEYGFSRQEVLKLNVQQTQQTKGKP